ncbi:PEP-CTERM sorting domain-containing protein [Roseateles oligotrophus]|uniref:PEP-CTERM sorting domain-containing protein n=1 Tax=Roseateles oligotrophus TaxID=1769250 RepID=A0ABT2YF87_9BURK|nr:PEP-CTERM sorting domain-containing protein [Roseateles oligotrophus]MCV2368718.1 PEP-CTERM sorting domain-containing protein [Roseateles oligotrophus]
MFKRTLVSLAAVAATFVGGSASAAVSFAMGAGGSNISFTDMVWQAGNAVIIDAQSTMANRTFVPIGTNPDGSTKYGQLLHTVAQARLSAFTLTDGSNASYSGQREITYQADFWEVATGIGTASAAFSLAPASLGLKSTINFYYQDATTGPGLGFYGNNNTGANYGTEGGATLILSGDLTRLDGSFNDTTIANGSPLTNLDTSAGNDTAPGTKTHQGTGNNNIDVDVTYQNNAFFLSNVSGLTLDMNQNVGVGAPFNVGNPWSQVVGHVPRFTLEAGNKRVNMSTGSSTTGPCNLGGQTQAGVTTLGHCDILLQTTGLTSFVAAVPEPGSLALVGFALAGVGFTARRRKAA